ncbi:Uridine phosphorylase 1 [Branchiostoma belcheri]|nr:Uridine phosphorylase 1 [Branchiostoma belcheri]
MSMDSGDQHCDTSNGYVHLHNPHLKTMASDFLYHFNLGTATHDLPAMFGDVKFVVVGGSPTRMGKFARFIHQELGLPESEEPRDLADTDRYGMFKAGPVLSVSHGMGMPSMSIMLNELLKLLYHARCSNVVMFRMGTSGGLGLEPGTVVISKAAVDACFRPRYTQIVLGKETSRPSELDQSLVDELLHVAGQEDGVTAVTGNTMCANGFYEEQGRLDGAFCDYTEEDKLQYLQKARDAGVRNIEMESLCFAALCKNAGVKAGVVCVTLVDRLRGDQVTTPHDTLKEWELRPQKLLARFIRSRLGIK